MNLRKYPRSSCLPTSKKLIMLPSFLSLKPLIPIIDSFAAELGFIHLLYEGVVNAWT